MAKRLERRRKAKPGPENIAAREAGLVMPVTRQQAIMRELDTAIWLWFIKHDPLSVHLIVMAAHKCLRDIGGKEKGPTAHLHVSKTLFTLAYDWLRHASADPTDMLDFPFRTNELALWDCVGAFIRIYGISSSLMDAFAAYFALHLAPENPDVREGADAFLPEGVTIEEVDNLTPSAFLAKTVPLFNARKLRPN
jgi:hypothetical protein